MNRGRRRDTIFRESDDYRYFIVLLKDAAESWNFRIAAYCLMANHYHLLVQTPEANLARCMRHINGLYTQRYNRRYHEDGQLFRGRYKSILVDADSYLLELVKYIHRNPLRAGIADTLSSYAWTSHKGYLSRSETWAWPHKEFILSMLTKSKTQGKAAYASLMGEEESAGTLAFFAQRTQPAIMDAEDFIDRIRRQFYMQKPNRHVPQSRILALPIDFIKQTVAQAYGTDTERLTIARRGFFSEPRNVAIYLARKHSGKTLLEIGAAFGMHQYSSVSGVVNKILRLCRENKKIQAGVRGVEAMLLKGQS
jgi:REP element-mobilizing transposase RayT